MAGMAATALFANVSVHLTDLPTIVPNLINNVENNSHLFNHPPSTAVLDWSQLPRKVEPFERYQCILAADSLYDPRHPEWLTDAMSLFLQEEKGARIIVELPFRDMDLPYHNILRKEMAKKGFAIIEEGEDSGWDDWEGAWCEKMAVRCWWSVWGWTEQTLGQEPITENATGAADNKPRPGKQDVKKINDDGGVEILNQRKHLISEQQRQQQQQQLCVSNQLFLEQAVVATADLSKNAEVSQNSFDIVQDGLRSSHKQSERGQYILPHLRGLP